MELLIAKPHSLSSVFWAIRFSFLLVILPATKSLFHRRFKSNANYRKWLSWAIVFDEMKSFPIVFSAPLCHVNSPSPRINIPAKNSIAQRRFADRLLNVLIRLICRDEFARSKSLVNIWRGAIRLWADSSRQIYMCGTRIIPSNRSLSLETKFGRV